MDLRVIAQPLIPLPGLVLVGIALHLSASPAVLAVAFVAAFALTFRLMRWTRAL